MDLSTLYDLSEYPQDRWESLRALNVINLALGAGDLFGSDGPVSGTGLGANDTVVVTIFPDDQRVRGLLARLLSPDRYVVEAAKVRNTAWFDWE